MLTSTNWQDLVARKRQECQDKLPREWKLGEEVLKAVPEHLLQYDLPRRSGILTEEELDITENYTATQLLAKLASGQITSLSVTTAFSKRAAIAQQVVSCLTETCFPEALDRARYLDEYLQKEGKPMGPLHGLPISIKESFNIKGLQTTLGYVSCLSRPPSTTESALVTLLLDLGAVLYVKTNVPQTLMTADSENNVFGRTLNPHNTSLTAGGSSGGEGALVAFRGSILGVGTDIAGSIRIPSLCCGIYGFKPTTNRVPFGGQFSGEMEGIPNLIPCAGPLGHSLADLKRFMATVVGSDSAWRYDATAVAVPWKQGVEVGNTRNGSLNIGVLAEDNHFPLHPPVRRALERAVDALAKAGHRIIKLDNGSNHDLSLSYASRLAFQYFTYAPHPDLITPSGEPVVKSLANLSSPMFTGPLPVEPEKEPYTKINDLHMAREKYAESWRREWVDKNLDVVLAPGAQSSAVAHDTYAWPSYTVIWNLLDYPACIIPYGKVSRELDGEEMMTGDNVQPDYHPDQVDGAPCAIQVITPRFHDEQCLAAAELIERAIRE
ncbi:Uncharacterized protein PECH_006218 [Penicillium ucsense]|uniref:amidase n=1 Tax=Penicillium ucsense TaxID=2839758 RepID=A0A8J8W3T0_9EURO|nr:Uncharacterized protein PECM_006542 [Penicillium ucsense]KAF7735751.1 Uncharacterized protein PECH_006218 [Penicillium ucsense]